LKKNILIIILIIVVIAVSFGWFIREGINLQKLNKLNQSTLDKDRVYDLTLTQFIISADTLFKHFQKFYWQYKEQAILLTEQEGKDEIKDELMLYEGVFKATAYTSAECGYITKIGIDLRENYSRYFNVAAVDPRVIPLGSVLIVEIDKQIYTFIAADTGSLIKGKKLDLYFRTSPEIAKKFGVQNVKVWLLDNKKFGI